MTAAPAAPCLRDVLAEALWIAHCWHHDAEFGNPAQAAAYEELHDTVVTAPTDEAALDLLRDALAEGSAEPGDLAAGSLGGLGLTAATAGGDAGTEDGKTIPGVGK